MPAIAAYIGLHDVTGLVYKSPGEYFYHSYPFRYSRELFSNYITESDFYKAVFDAFCKEDGLKLSDCDILVTGFLEPPILSFELKLYKSLYEVMRGVSRYFPILVNNFAILTPDQIFCQDPVPSNVRSARNPDEENFYGNLCVYNHMVVSDIVSRVDMDSSLLRNLSGDNLVASPKNPIVFMGSRFGKMQGVSEFNTLLMLDILSAGGISSIYTDPENTVLLSQLFRMYYGGSISVAESPEKVGTLISKRTSIECMVSNQYGVSQIVELEKDKVFVLPLDVKDTAKLVVKSPGENTQECTVGGGNVGLIFDTREHKGNISMDFKTFNASIKSLSGSIGS